MKKKSIEKLTAIYDAIGGLMSEMTDPFDGKYEGGTDQLLTDFETILEECGVKFAKREKGNYFIVSYMGFKGPEWEAMGVKPKKGWGICTDKENPDVSWVLTGFDTAADALETIMDPNLFDDYNGKPVEVIDAVANEGK